MADTNYEGWTRFYSEFADVLKGYKNRQGEIVAGIKRAFEAQGVRLVERVEAVSLPKLIHSLCLACSTKV